MLYHIISCHIMSIGCIDSVRVGGGGGGGVWVFILPTAVPTTKIKDMARKVCYIISYHVISYQ